MATRILSFIIFKSDGSKDKFYGLGPVGFPKEVLPVAMIAVSL